ncbi:hypothetical protein BDV39DRAFT_200851 [Aspergillus sergii]|uniref:Uncharacterized protein n=1 Tax=Aspergillus sergii TaxID=1034303 RepID=A0A5N6XH77_9EURO|nr:hypothetical protein BDV39DRAFT_200851 [Aspergillus sergii]
MSEGYLYAIATILGPMSKLEKTRKEPWIDDDIDWYQEYGHVFEKVFDLCRLHNPGVNVGSILFQLARDFLTVATNGVGVERLLNSSRDICHYRRSCLQSDTIEAIILQMCTDRLQISEDFIVPQAEMDSEEIQIVSEQEQGNDDTLSNVYISDIEDLDDLGRQTKEQQVWILFGDHTISRFIEYNMHKKMLPEIAAQIRPKTIASVMKTISTNKEDNTDDDSEPIEATLINKEADGELSGLLGQSRSHLYFSDIYDLSYEPDNEQFAPPSTSKRPRRQTEISDNELESRPKRKRGRVEESSQPKIPVPETAKIQSNTETALEPPQSGPSASEESHEESP